MKRQMAMRLKENLERFEAERTIVQRRNPLETTEDGFIKLDATPKSPSESLPSRRVYEVIVELPLEGSPVEENPTNRLGFEPETLNQLRTVYMDYELVEEDTDTSLLRISIYNGEGDELEEDEQELYEIYERFREEGVAHRTAGNIALTVETWNEFTELVAEDLLALPEVDRAYAEELVELKPEILN